MVVTTNLSLLSLQNLETTEKNYENINTDVSYSVLCCFTNVSVDSACQQLTVASSQARNLLRPNNLSGDLTDDYLSLNKFPNRAVYFTIVDETCSCHLLIMLGDGPRCKVLGDNSFSAY